MERFGWSDTAMLLQFVPARLPARFSALSPLTPLQLTIPQLLSGITTAMVMMAASPTALLFFPGLANANSSTAALSQWASCGVLGMPFHTLAALIPAVGAALNAAMPYPPELCGWAQQNLGLSQANASIPLSTAKARLRRRSVARAPPLTQRPAVQKFMSALSASASAVECRALARLTLPLLQTATSRMR